MTRPLDRAIEKSGKVAEKVVEAGLTALFTPARVVEKSALAVDRGLKRLFGMDW